MRGAYIRIVKNYGYDPKDNTPWGQNESDKRKVEVYYNQVLKMTLTISHYDSEEEAVKFAKLTCDVLNENTEYKSGEGIVKKDSE